MIDAAASLPAGAVTTRTTDPQVQQARVQQVPPTGTQPPIIDLPPIEGAPEVQVPNLTPGPLTGRRTSSRCPVPTER